MADVFISYHEASAGEIVKQIAAALKDVGVSCWYAERDLTKSGSFADTITKEIRSCRVFLLVQNEECNRSEYVKSELNFAFDRKHNQEKIELLSFQVDDSKPSDEIMLFIGRFQNMNGTPPDKKHIQDLAERIAGTLKGLPTWAMIHEKEEQIQQLASRLNHTQAHMQKAEHAKEEEIAKLKNEVQLAYFQTDMLAGRLGQKQAQMQKLKALQEQVQSLEHELEQEQDWIQGLKSNLPIEWEAEQLNQVGLQIELKNKQRDVKSLTALFIIFYILALLLVGIMLIQGKSIFGLSPSKPSPWEEEEETQSVYRPPSDDTVESLSPPALSDVSEVVAGEPEVPPESWN